MPITTQAEKALRKAKKRSARNAVIRAGYKQAVKGVKKARAAGQETKDLLILAQKKLDKAAKRGVLNKKTAARTLSRLAAYIQAEVKKT